MKELIFRVSNLVLAFALYDYKYMSTCSPKGAYGVPIQYERSFRWKLGQFRYLCQVSTYISYTCTCMCIVSGLTRTMAYGSYHVEYNE